MSSFNYITQENDRVDILAQRFYGGMYGIKILSEANPLVPMYPVCPVGSVLVIPVLSQDSVVNNNLPPWKSGVAAPGFNLRPWNPDIFKPSIFVAVALIGGVNNSFEAGEQLTLAGTIIPDSATNKTIEWSVISATATGVTLVDNVLSAETEGTIVVRATIINGASSTTDYVQDFTITVQPAFVPVDQIINMPDSTEATRQLILAGEVVPVNATNQSIVWSILDAGETGATISGNALDTLSMGNVIIQATIINGAGKTTNYIQTFYVNVGMLLPDRLFRLDFKNETDNDEFHITDDIGGAVFMRLNGDIGTMGFINNYQGFKRVLTNGSSPAAENHYRGTWSDIYNKVKGFPVLSRTSPSNNVPFTVIGFYTHGNWTGNTNFFNVFERISPLGAVVDGGMNGLYNGVAGARWVGRVSYTGVTGSEIAMFVAQWDGQSNFGTSKNEIGFTGINMQTNLDPTSFGIENLSDSSFVEILGSPENTQQIMAGFTIYAGMLTEEQIQYIFENKIV